MPIKSKTVKDEKQNLHPRNKHRGRYDFPQLIDSSPQLAGFVLLNQFGDLSVNFKDPEAVKALNRALLKYFYNINFWDIPKGYLCPPIPGRADYIHYVADLLANENKGIIPKGKQVKVLDIGTGANCIYPIVGHREYGWSFVGSDIDPAAIRSAKNIVEANSLSKSIVIKKQSSPVHIFTDIIEPADFFDLTVCNPPFHASLKDAMAGTERKWKNLGKTEKTTGPLNFGGQNNELWCKGGEEQFLNNMIYESRTFAKNCLWFTSLISKKTTLPDCYKALEKANVTQVKTIDMAQGQKVSRILAWTFFDDKEQPQGHNK